MKRVLVDSNIFLDYYLDRKDNMLPLGEFAFQFINRAIKCEFFFFITKDVLFEIKNVLGASEEHVWKNVFGALANKNKIEMIEYCKQTEQNAVKLARRENIPKTDALLIEVAKEKDVSIVSRNFHFEKAKNAVRIFKPEELT